ncbi:MAG: DNA translocase FtsK 4TM domain-containing protein [Polyangia bacterium]
MATAKDKGETPGRGREILGIGLLGLGVFCMVALVSMQAGHGRLMGPGGAAAATGLYSLTGLCAYPLVAGILLLAVRMCRARRLIEDVAGALGFMALLCSVAVLLHLPFAGEPVTLRGPGGLLGQWLAEGAGSVVGGVGAAMAAATLLSISLILLTHVSVGEVFTALAWAARSAGRATLVVARAGLWLAVTGARSIGRMVVAMFPEKEEVQKTQNAEPFEAEAVWDDAPEEDGASAAALAAPVETLQEGDSNVNGAEHLGMTVDFAEPGESMDALPDEAPVVHENEERRAMAALVAEVAAVECAAPVVPAGDAKQPSVDVKPEPCIVPAVTAALEEGVTEKSAEPFDEEVGAGPVIVQSVSRAETDDSPADQVACEPGDGLGYVRLSDGAFQLPGTDLLEYSPPEGGAIDEKTLKAMAARLEQAMGNYGVRGNVTAIQMGPVITTFEFAPVPGTRTGKIVQLENDLAMALEAQSVRIVAPIPGKAVVGVEIPNKNRETVYLKEILEDDSFRKASSKLQICMGKDTKGAPVSVNLAKMPHLLVAGTTGSGKSVAVNGMITSILYSATPEEVRFIMVDPKQLELSIYEGIPHLLLPVVVDSKKASLALRWAVDEMERRYELLSKSGVRDISSYNAKIEAARSQAENAVVAPLAESPSKRGKRLKLFIAGEDGVEREVEVEADSESAPMQAAGDGTISEERAEEISAAAAAVQAAKESGEAPARKLPYIVIVIDEFADLMMAAPKDVETAVARLAQKARAAGLHLILATQRPSVDVITGLIKANFPSRIALQVACKIDSRTILDQPGAETLLGNGDMLFSDRGTKLKRIQGAFLSDGEVHRVVETLKKQAKPVYDMNILTERDEDGEDGGAPREEFTDALYDQAVAIVCDTRQASVSFIQRRLQIGYNRAARMVEQMERDGLVGPANGIKPREVLAPRGEYLAAAD